MTEILITNIILLVFFGIAALAIIIAASINVIERRYDFKVEKINYARMMCEEQKKACADSITETTGNRGTRTKVLNTPNVTPHD
jgi:hypothetical protein